AYSRNDPVPEGLNEGSVSLIFKDEYKVRYDREIKVFKSLTGADVSNINNPINSHNIEKVVGYFDISEEQAEKDEKDIEKYYGYDAVNQLSSYGFYIRGTILKLL